MIPNKIKTLPKKLIILTTVGIAVNALLFFALVLPTLSGIQKEKHENEILISENLAAEEEQKNIIKLLKDKEVLDEKRNNINQLFIDEKTVLNFIQNIEDIGKKTNVSVTMDFGEPEKETEGMSERSITLNVHGQWRDMLEFLEKIEANRPLIKIETMSVSAQNPSAEKKDGINLTAGIKVPFFQEKNSAPENK